MGDFAERAFSVVRRIPRGKVATYGQVARLMGSPRSARYVGFALRSNPHPGTGPDSIPCHRVVFKDGSLCKGFAFGGPDVQRSLLAEEGVAFIEDERGAQRSPETSEAPGSDEPVRVDMEACQWDGRAAEAGADDRPTAPPPDFDWAAELGEWS